MRSLSVNEFIMTPFSANVRQMSFNEDFADSESLPTSRRTEHQLTGNAYNEDTLSADYALKTNYQLRENRPKSAGGRCRNYNAQNGLLAVQSSSSGDDDRDHATLESSVGKIELEDSSNALRNQDFRLAVRQRTFINRPEDSDVDNVDLLGLSSRLEFYQPTPLFGDTAPLSARRPLEAGNSLSHLLAARERVLERYDRKRRIDDGVSVGRHHVGNGHMMMPLSSRVTSPSLSARKSHQSSYVHHRRRLEPIASPLLIRENSECAELSPDGAS